MDPTDPFATVCAQLHFAALMVVQALQGRRDPSPALQLLRTAVGEANKYLYFEADPTERLHLEAIGVLAPGQLAAHNPVAGQVSPSPASHHTAPSPGNDRPTDGTPPSQSRHPGEGSFFLPDPAGGA